MTNPKQKTPQTKLQAVMVDLSAQQQIEGYEKHNQKQHYEGKHGKDRKAHS